MKGGIRAAAALLGLAAATVAGVTADADGFGARQPGRHVYDRAAVLAPGQVEDLEAGAAAVERAGAPTAVLVQLKAADDAAARQDARSLMDVWDVESGPGTRDGLVVVVDLRPEDPRHGSAALLAGSRHAASGRLTDARLQAIHDTEMGPRLATGDLAGALGAALAAAAAALAAPPQPSDPVVPDQGLRSPDRSQGPSAAVVIGLVVGLVLLVGAGALLLGLAGRGDGGGGGVPPGPAPRHEPRGSVSEPGPAVQVDEPGVGEG
jgi:uncharacterized membrane protein YgcG